MCINNELHLPHLIRQYKLACNSDYANKLIDMITDRIIYLSKLKPTIGGNNPLTMMETLCLIFLAIGNKPAKCADLLGISIKTIRTYEQRTREKLGAINRTNAFYLSQINGYITVVV